MNIWLASGNAHKKLELEAIFRTKGCDRDTVIRVPADAGIDSFDPPETGSSFVENALIKARSLYRILKEKQPSSFRDPVLADDSGLCVEALEGRPGIFSARYGAEDGRKLEAAERNALLLEELAARLESLPPEKQNRKAHFVCAMVLYYSQERFFIAQETFEGELVDTIGSGRGSGGFGYDPILYIPSLGRTAAELSEDEKNAVSHRGKAGKAIAGFLASR
ncbi:MAG: non-canonical purine NTP pyrophosphatase [Treponema sp.]|jgi:XTP/dITP diphosphohydrolase|nr:non-canonical purine NTP pyrophosphatase [Treponema sp.]